MASTDSPHCPCGRTDARGQTLGLTQCCGPFLAGEPAPSAEQLMRSRYSAFVRGDVPYLLATWHASTRPAELSLEASARWLGLEVRHHHMTGPQTAEVEFVARFRVAGRAVRQHERSRFVQEEGRWFYLDGQADASGAPAFQRQSGGFGDGV
jgi:SEC-C motif-containing protein